MNINLDPVEAEEWLDSFDAVTRFNGSNVSSELIQRLTDHAREQGVKLPAAITTPFKNTINPEDERVMPGDLFMERRIRSLIRWNAMAMVMRANDNEDGLGGHISSFSSSATLYDVGMNYFFRGTGNGHPGILSSIKDTVLPVCTHARIWKAFSTRANSKTSDVRSQEKASRPILTHG